MCTNTVLPPTLVPDLVVSVMTRGHSLNTCSRMEHTMHRETTREQAMHTDTTTICTHTGVERAVAAHNICVLIQNFNTVTTPPAVAAWSMDIASLNTCALPCWVRGHNLNTCSRTVHTMHRETTMEQTMQAGHGVLHCSRSRAADLWLHKWPLPSMWCSLGRLGRHPVYITHAHTDTTTICTQTQGWRGQ